MLTTVTRKYIFDAAHEIPGFPEQHRCRHMHGHTYELRVTWCPDVGSPTPFEEIDPLIRSVVDLLDHRVWNEHVPSGTLEDLGPWLFERIEEVAKAVPGFVLMQVTLDEGRNSSVTVRP